MEKDPVEDGTEQEAAPPGIDPATGMRYATGEDPIEAGSVAGRGQWGPAELDDAGLGQSGSFVAGGKAMDAIREKMMPNMHLFEVEIEPALSAEAITERGPVQRYAVVAATAREAYEEAERRWHDNIRLNVHIEERRPILVERISKNVTQTTDAPRGAWWRRIFG